ncbi:MAG TPA: hypothetical protein VFV50_06630 [Bdellovibrionales bacterium]|nr:hypothetical protein [Bdellovibrionales bacterium]
MALRSKASQNSSPSAKERLEKEYRITDLGDPDSLVAATLQFVVDDNFDRAIHELRVYQAMKSTFPLYVDRTQRYFDHCVEVIEAIRTKRAVPTHNLPAAKRQELSEKIFMHFHELKDSLTKITHIESELRVQDAKSTVWVIQAFCICLFFLMLFAVFLEAYRTMRIPVTVVFSDIMDWILLKIGI